MLKAGMVIVALMAVGMSAGWAQAPDLAPIARNADNSVRHMSFHEAEAYCRGHGMRLPTARELALYALTLGAEGMSDAPNPDWNIIKGSDPEGRPDSFYFSGFPGAEKKELGKTWLWSSSISPDDRDFAYVLILRFGDFGHHYLGDPGVDSGVRCARPPVEETPGA